MVEQATSPHVKSAMRTLDIIEYLVARNQSVVAQEVAEALNIPVSSLSYLLTTLVERGYLTRDGRRYGIGPGLERLQLRKSSFSIVDQVSPLVSTLRMQLNETASFFLRHGWEVETLATATSEHALRYAVATGARMPLHGLSAGKAILAVLPDSDLDTYFRETARTQFTAATIVSEEALRREIAEIRELGFARTREEQTPGIQGIGRAVVVGDNQLGAFGVAIPTVRFDQDVERRVVDVLKRTTALLESA